MCVCVCALRIHYKRVLLYILAKAVFHGPSQGTMNMYCTRCYTPAQDAHRNRIAPQLSSVLVKLRYIYLDSDLLHMLLVGLELGVWIGIEAERRGR